VARVFGSALLARNAEPRRSFREDAQTCVTRLRPPLHVLERKRIPSEGPCLITVNHYARPGFRAWWIALAISAVIPVDVYWAMTGAWTYPDRFRTLTITRMTRWLFRRLASLYGFTTMPPMPPDPRDTTARALAVRQVLAHAHSTPRPIIALSPEGSDAPDGTLQMPPSGAGRFMLHLARRGLALVPVGSFESGGAFCLRFGPPYQLVVPRTLSPEIRDRQASHIAMSHIARQLPAHLRGTFAQPETDLERGDDS